MNKLENLKKYNDEDKLLLSKILDKIRLSKENNKITNTDFLNLYEQKIVNELLSKIKENNFIFYGGFEKAERKILIKYTDKFDFLIENNLLKIEDIIKVIRIELPNQMYGKYSHRDYLSGLMKLGIKREKIGDILVDDNGADIIVKNDVLNFLIQELKLLKRFSKSKIYEIKLKELREQIIQKEEINILVPSLRLDCVVSELINVSRNKASEIILSERVFINYSIETKISKEIKIGDIITIRGKGRYIIKKLNGISKKDKQKVLIEKFKKR